MFWPASAPRAVVAARDGASAGALGGLAFALIGKMTALFVLVFLALRVAHLAVMPFGLGFLGAGLLDPAGLARRAVR